MVRIGSSGLDNLGTSNLGSIGGAGSDLRTSTGTSATRSDSVNLSSAANLLSLAKSTAPSRLSKIQSLSAEVKSGAYQADTGQVSQAVVQNHISA